METIKMGKFIRFDFDKEDLIGIITIDNPPANSLSSVVLTELGDMIDAAFM